MRTPVYIIPILLFLCLLEGQARLLRSPSIREIFPSFSSAGQIVNIKGSGFIKNYPELHHLVINKRKTVTVLASEGDMLTIQLPSNLPYGDYDLGLQIKSRFFRSKFIEYPRILSLRPKAPPAPNLDYKVIKNPKELPNLNQSLEYLEPKEELKIGENYLITYYYEDGYRSQNSSGTKFYYLPNFEKLSVISDNPIKALAVSKDSKPIDVSEVTNYSGQELSKNFYLTTPSDPRYLLLSIKLNPLYINTVHAGGNEAIILANRSSIKQSLKSCTLADSLKVRYSFKDSDEIAPLANLSLEGNFGLNDDGDSVSFVCQNQEIDKFEYNKIDLEGFAIKI